MASQEFNRVLQTTIAEYMLGAEDETIRNRKLLALMKAKGRITFGHYGTQLDWGIRYKQRDIDGYADGDTLSFQRSDLSKRANVPWRGYTMTDMVTKKEKLMNRGKAALIKYVSEMVEGMMEDFQVRFHKQLYIDGNASGNSKKIHGFDSFTGTSGASSGNYIATPSDSYASLNTDLGSYGGTWTGTWPSGEGDSEYDFFSPILVDNTNTGFGASTHTWAANAVDIMRFGIVKAKRNDSKLGMIDVVLLDGELYRQYETLLDTKERAIVQQGQGLPTLRNLGFGDTIWFEGAEVTWEYGVPNDASGDPQGYGFNVDMLELCSLQDTLFSSEGPFYDEASLSERFAIHMFGNMKWRPRYFVKFASYS